MLPSICHQSLAFMSFVTIVIIDRSHLRVDLLDLLDLQLTCLFFYHDVPGRRATRSRYRDFRRPGGEVLVRSDEKKMSLDGFKCPKLIVVDCPHEALAGGYELSPVDFDGCPVYWSPEGCLLDPW